MKNRLLRLEIIGFVFVSILGTLSHFFYEWSGNNKLVGLFSPVNESPWEHLKLLFFPFIVYTIFTSIKLKKDKFNMFFAGYVSVLVGMICTLCYFYTINGILGGDNTWVNISSYFVGVLIAFAINYFIIKNSIGNDLLNGLAIGMIIVTAIVFILFTFSPPIIPLFKDPISLKYGI